MRNYREEIPIEKHHSAIYFPETYRFQFTIPKYLKFICL